MNFWNSLRRPMQTWALIGTMAAMSACSHMETKMWDQSASFGPVTKVSSAHYLWGNFAETVGAPCTKGVARIERGFTSAQFFMTIFSLGLYSPDTHIITCKG